MLCGCRRDRWPIRYMMANEVERVVTMWGCFAPCLANLLASSFPTTLVWALTSHMVILLWVF